MFFYWFVSTNSLVGTYSANDITSDLLHLEHTRLQDTKFKRILVWLKIIRFIIADFFLISLFQKSSVPKEIKECIDFY